jgi:hypothetical protein
MSIETDQLRPAEPRRSTRSRRWFRRVVFGLLFVLLLAIAAIQVALWTDLPRRIVIAQVQRQLGLSVTATSLTTGWLGQTELHDVTLALPLAEQSLLDVPTLRVKHTALVPLLLGFSITIDSLDLERPVLHVRQDVSGAWNLRQAVELIARAGGSRQAQQQPQGTKNPLRLPELRVNDGKAYVADNRGQIAPVDGINVTGWREGLLVYKYDADVGKRLHVIGELAPTARWDHEVRFAARQLNELLEPLVHDVPKDISADGTWRGRLTADGAEGRLELTSFSTQQGSASGVALIGLSDSSIEVRPERLLIKLPQSEVRLISGLLTMSSQSIRADDLIVAGYDGQAVIGGQWNRSDGSATLRAVWRQIALPATMSQSGTIEASLQTPWTGRPQIDVTVSASCRAPLGTIETALHVSGQGDSLQNIDWNAAIDRVNWTGKRTFALRNVSARLRTRGPQLMLDELVLNDDPNTPLSARGQINLQGDDWWLWLYSPGTTLRNRRDEALPPIAFSLNSWGNTRFVELKDFYASSGDLKIDGDGFYNAELPKPVNINLRMEHLPIPPEPELADIVRGELTGKLSVLGTAAPLNLELGGELRGRKLFLRQREVGELAAELKGLVDENGVTLSTTELELLGGRWQVNGDWPGVREQPIHLRVDCKQLPLAEVGQFIRKPELRGMVDAQANIDVPSLRLARIRARGSLEARNIVAPGVLAEHATAQFRLSDGILVVDPIHLTQHEGVADAKLEIPLSQRGHINLDGSVKQWPVDTEGQRAAAAVTGKAQLDVDLRKGTAAGPVQLSAHLTARDRPVGTVRVEAEFEQQSINATRIQADVLGGSATGQARINVADPLQTTAKLEWNDIDSSEFSAWFPVLKGLIGRGSGSLSLGPSPDPRHALGPLRLDADFRSDRGQFRGMQIAHSNFTAFFDRDRFVTDGAKIGLATGTANVFARATRRPGEPFSVLLTVDFDQLDLDQIAHAIKADAKPMPGRAQGRLTLGGEPTRRGEMFGQGHLLLTQCDLVNLPAVAALYNFMHIDLGSPQPTGTATVRLRLEHGDLFVERARIFNRGVEILGLGAIREVWKAPDSPVEGSAVGSAQPLSNIKLPFMADVNKIFSVLQGQLTSVKISGTLAKHNVVQSTLADVGQSMRSLLLGNVQSETRGGAQP